MSLLGQVVASGETVDGTVPVANIGAGTYLIEVTSEGKTAIKRFIKQ